MRKFLIFLIALSLALPAYAAPDRAVAPGNLTATRTDLNEELTEIYDNLNQPLDTVAGTNAYTASVAGMPALTSYQDGQKFRIKIPNSNTATAITLNIDGLGALQVFDRAGSAIPIGGLQANSVYYVEYLGGTDNHFRVLSPTTTSAAINDEFCVAASDETTVLTTGVRKVSFNFPRAMSIANVFAYLRTASTSGIVTVDINEDTDAEGAGAALSIMTTTKLTIDQGERRSSTAATPPAITDSAIAQHSEMSIDIDTAGANATGLKVCFVGTFS